MLKIPDCLKCQKLLGKGSMKCSAFPEGIPQEVIKEKKKEGCICNNGIGFIKRDIE